MRMHDIQIWDYRNMFILNKYYKILRRYNQRIKSSPDHNCMWSGEL